MTVILSSDILIADVIAEVAGSDALAALIRKYELVPGGKRAIDEAQFHEFSAAVADRPITMAPGGSSANMLTTLGKLFDGGLDIRLIGAAGQGFSSQMIRVSLEEAGVKLLPESLPSSPVAKTAMSYVLLLPGGERTIVTYPGNAREILLPAIITDAMVAAADIVLLQGSLWGKLGPEYADRLYQLSLKHKKQIWLALPTHSMVGGNHIEAFKDVIPHTTLVLGNEEELARVFKATTLQALKQLQQLMHAGQVGFITLGERGAAVVTAEHVHNVPLHEVPTANIVNTLGAGDTAFAGFAYGYLKGLDVAQSAHIAMLLARAKLSVNASRLPDPKSFLPLATKK